MNENVENKISFELGSEAKFSWQESGFLYRSCTHIPLDKVLDLAEIIFANREDIDKALRKRLLDRRTYLRDQADKTIAEMQEIDERLNV